MMSVSALIGAALWCMVMSSVCGHLCLISPPQRGPLGDLNTKGAKDCFQMHGPCGSVPAPSSPSQVILLNEKFSNITVVFQKNLDHFNSATPGYFSVALGEKAGGRSAAGVAFKEIARLADSSTAPSLHLYDLNLKLPLKSCPWYILQVSYITKNPKAPPAFFQCADFSVVLQ